MPRNPKTPAGQPVIKVNHQRLQIVLNYRGVRKYLSLGLPDSKPNRVYAEMVRTRIMSDLLNDNFDPTLEKYLREALKPDSEIHTHDDISIAQLWEQYTNYKRPQLAPSTIAKDFDRVSIYIDRFPELTLDDAVAVRDYLNLKTTPNTTKRVLTQLGACCKWGVKSKLIAVNPFLGMAADIKLPKVWREGLEVAMKIKGSQGKPRRVWVKQEHPFTTISPASDVHANQVESFNSALRRQATACLVALFASGFPTGAHRYRRRQNHCAKVVTGLQRALNVQRLLPNWVRPHWGLGKKTTPAMAIGSIDRPVTISEILSSTSFEDFTP